MFLILENLFKKRELTVYHPESSGIKITVYRSWWKTLFLNNDFATLSEVIAKNK